MKASRRKPDYEASEVEIKADRIDDPEYVPVKKTDGRNRIKIGGHIEINIRKQHRGTRDEEVRPPAGSTIGGDCDDVTVEARRINKVRPTKDGTGRKSTTASGSVEIFGKLKRLLK